MVRIETLPSLNSLMKGAKIRTPIVAVAAVWTWSEEFCQSLVKETEKEQEEEEERERKRREGERAKESGCRTGERSGKIESE